MDPTAARGERLVDVRHEAIKKTPNGWAESLTPAAETSPAVKDIPTKSLAPYLAIHVNGVPIAVRGGSWGTDDILKRVSRERLEPYFKLHRAANLNMIRQYFTELAKGFSVEVGTPSLATLESIESMIPEADRWPISDTLAYHDWHHGGNGDVARFMSALENQFGAPTSLADFERKAQMLNYVSVYRAVFEGFQARLGTENSGRLLWMTHPAWPSNHWQIYSSDYDTQASYYGVKSACEPVHAQVNLPDYSLAVVNTTRQERRGLTLTSRVFALDGRLLSRHVSKVSAAANSTLTLPPLNLSPLLASEDLVLVALTLEGPDGQPLSQNIYWQGGKRVLPVQYSDNYITLLPHEPARWRFSAPRAASGRISGCGAGTWFRHQFTSAAAPEAGPLRRAP